MTKKLDRCELLDNQYNALYASINRHVRWFLTDADIDRQIERIAKTAKEVRDERAKEYQDWGYGLVDR